MRKATLHGHSRGTAWALLTVLALASGLVPSHALAAKPVEFQLATLDGRAFVKIADFPNRAVLINIWGTECPPCVEEAPLLNAQSRIYTNVQFLGIATDDRISSLRFASRLNVRYPQVQAPMHPDGLLRRLGDLHGALPFTVVLDTEHRICASRLGKVDVEWIRSVVKVCATE
jgi:thiol-disulfide isomerase/thioredoxin